MESPHVAFVSPGHGRIVRPSPPRAMTSAASWWHSVETIIDRRADPGLRCDCRRRCLPVAFVPDCRGAQVLDGVRRVEWRLVAGATADRDRPVGPDPSAAALTKPSDRFTICGVTWAEVFRKLKAAGFVEVRAGKGSHLLLKHLISGKEVWVAVHTKKDAGRLGNRILREAGVE